MAISLLTVLNNNQNLNCIKKRKTASAMNIPNDSSSPSFNGYELRGIYPTENKRELFEAAKKLYGYNSSAIKEACDDYYRRGEGFAGMFSVPKENRAKAEEFFRSLMIAVDKVITYKNTLSGKRLANLEAHKKDGLEYNNVFLEILGALCAPGKYTPRT